MKIRGQTNAHEDLSERDRARSSNDTAFAQYLEREISGPGGSANHAWQETELVDVKEPESLLVQHRLPEWMTRYRSPLQDLSTSHAAIEETKRHFAEPGQDALPNAPATQELKQQSALASRFRAELHELAQLRKRALDASLSGVGLSRDSLSLLHDNPQLSSRVHESFHEALTRDPRARELMHRLGIDQE